MIERGPGTYALVLSSTCDERIAVGQLGPLRVRPGYYVYVGSAFGSGGVRARVDRHLRGPGKAHWHIDYLRAVTSVEEVWVAYGDSRNEHLWAQTLLGLESAEVPQPGFGSSDCKCVAHLCYFATRPSRDGFQESVHVPIQSP